MASTSKKLSTPSGPTLAEKIKANVSKGEGFKCYKCGKTLSTLSAGFYKNSKSRLFSVHKGYTFMCKSCIHKLLKGMAEKDMPMVEQARAICVLLDLPFVPAFGMKLRPAAPNAMITEYCALVDTLPAGSPGSYIQSIVEPITPDGRKPNEAESGWDERSRYNRDYVIDIVGYDPFNDRSLSDDARKYLFNTMAGYCPDSSVSADSHKLQSIINIVQAQQQAHAIDELINREITSMNTNEATLSKYTVMKKDILAAIDKLATNNEISANAIKEGKGANTLSGRMQRLSKDNFKAIEVNNFDIKTSQAFQEIADISMKAIVNELQFLDNDYTDIIEEQRKMITQQNLDNDTLQEQNRKLNNSIIELKERLAVYEGDDDLG